LRCKLAQERDEATAKVAKMEKEKDAEVAELRFQLHLNERERTTFQ
jgi:hypothetical protein